MGAAAVTMETLYDQMLPPEGERVAERGMVRGGRGDKEVEGNMF